MIVSFVDKTTAYSYRLDSNFKLIKSVAMTNFKPHKIADPEKGAKAELAFWVMFADNI